MEEYKIWRTGTDKWNITFNGTEYNVTYDPYAGYYRLATAGHNGEIFDANYLNADRYGDNRKAFVGSQLFKEGFITERVHEKLEKYKIKEFYSRKGNSYIDCRCNYIHAINCETAFYKGGRYWYIKVGKDGLPEIEKAFFTLNGLMNFFEFTRSEAAASKGINNKTFFDTLKNRGLVAFLEDGINAGIITGTLIIIAIMIYKSVRKKKARDC